MSFTRSGVVSSHPSREDSDVVAASHHVKPMVELPEPRVGGAAPDPDLVEYLMVAVPELDSLSALTPALIDLVKNRAVRILDLVCLARSRDDGLLTVLEFEDVDCLAALEELDGEVGGLLSEGDIHTASIGLAPGSTGLLLLVEDRWAAQLSEAARRVGGRVVDGERISRPRLMAALGADAALGALGAGQ
jgi:hypothetical protein